jgi:hypothetical protein
METEAAISRLPIQDQEGFRYLARQNIERIINSKESKKTDNKLEYGSIKSIKQKLLDNNLAITRADKGKKVVIINKELNKKVELINTENGLRKLKKDPTVKFQRNVKEVVKNATLSLINLISINSFK